MKWIVFLVTLLGVVPWLGDRAARSEVVRRWLVFGIAFELFNPHHINLISDENYRGDSRGIEVTTVDLLALTLWLAQRARGRLPAGLTAPFFLPRMLYLGAALASLTATPELLRSLFSVWKIVRMYFYFVALEGAFAELTLARAFLDGLGAGVLWQGVLALQQKYIYHAVRVLGSQSHPNSLAMLVNLIAPSAFSLMLGGQGRRWAGGVVAVAAMCNVFSLCRGGMMMFVLSSSVVAAASMVRRPTAHKVKVLSWIVAGGALALLKSMDTIINRFVNAPKESELARKLFNQAAKAMAEEHPFGVGINMYSFVLDHGGYADRFTIEPGDRNGIAHHIYWLTSAELGYVGVAAYVLVLLSVLVAAARLALRKGVEGELGVGILAGLSITYLQGFAEWIARQTTMSYAFWGLAAIVAARLRTPPR
jgi:hypothetical protein